MDETKNPADSIMNEHIDTDVTEQNLVSIKLVKNSYMILNICRVTKWWKLET